MQSPQEIQTTFQLFIKDSFCGTLAGIANCISGHPIDTLKIRMQMTNNSFTHIIKQTLNQEGLLAFYQGMGSPLVTVPLVNAVVFSSYEFFKRLTHKENNKLSFKQGIYSGMFAGFVNSFVVSPIELIKCRLQMQNQHHKEFNGPLSLIKHVLKTQGLKGMFSTQLREIPCYAGQFAFYEWSKGTVLKFYKRDNLNTFESLLIGGCAGIAGWTCSYPQDVVKTRLQCDITDKYKKHILMKFDGGFISCWKYSVQKYGYMGLWTGFSACLLRAFLANAFMFLTYEWASQKYDYLKF